MVQTHATAKQVKVPEACMVTIFKHCKACLDFHNSYAVHNMKGATYCTVKSWSLARCRTTLAWHEIREHRRAVPCIMDKNPY